VVQPLAAVHHSSREPERDRRRLVDAAARGRHRRRGWRRGWRRGSRAREWSRVAAVDRKSVGASIEGRPAAAAAEVGRTPGRGLRAGNSIERARDDLADTRARVKRGGDRRKRSSPRASAGARASIVRLPASRSRRRRSRRRRRRRRRRDRGFPILQITPTRESFRVIEGSPKTRDAHLFRSPVPNVRRHAGGRNKNTARGRPGFARPSPRWPLIVP
jgi:hypothetical protein